MADRFCSYLRQQSGGGPRGCVWSCIPSDKLNEGLEGTLAKFHMEPEGLGSVTGEEVWMHECIPWPTRTGYKHSSALSTGSSMRWKNFPQDLPLTDTSSRSLSNKGGVGGHSDALISLHWVCMFLSEHLLLDLLCGCPEVLSRPTSLVWERMQPRA